MNERRAVKALGVRKNEMEKMTEPADYETLVIWR